MQGLKRKIVYVATFEAIAVAICAVAFTAISNKDFAHAGILSVATSLVAILWNLAFTTLFEAWEKGQALRGRSVKRRIVHAALYEGGLILMLVPLIAWWLEMTLVHAFATNLGLVAFFLVYAFCFSWCFDRIFGLPTSAAAREAA
ncbi:PACE efflux transporter [Noviherbaspirillum malthae]|uniref:PACE efflux transporter n=1 Tax=Noviherbaspirillum malthae TaxID=1260987 RepID=UPI00188F5722|nr:PACE efflux transporter [Noviherbaspirillum malthae]